MGCGLVTCVKSNPWLASNAAFNLARHPISASTDSSTVFLPMDDGRRGFPLVNHLRQREAIETGHYRFVRRLGPTTFAFAHDDIFHESRDALLYDARCAILSSADQVSPRGRAAKDGLSRSWQAAPGLVHVRQKLSQSLSHTH